MLSYDQVFENNKNWLNSKKASDKEFFEKLSLGQNPDFLFIGCSDSRVSPEQMIGAETGEIFVHRNVANLVSSIDMNAMSVIEYAVGHLEVKHIVVCGHYYCGGIAAALKNEDGGMLNPWLQQIRDVYRLHARELDALSDEDQKYRRLIERNVEEQCLNIYKTGVVQKAIHEGYEPRIHGWIFDIKSGKLHDLEINIEELLEGKRQIYDLGFK